MNRKKRKVGRSELLGHLSEQIGFLRASARAFDEGNVTEAKRIAAVIRTLVHSTKASHALLSQLGSSFRWRFFDTAMPYNPANLMSHHGLVTIRLEKTTSGGNASYRPLSEPGLPVPPGRKAFQEW